MPGENARRALKDNARSCKMFLKPDAAHRYRTVLYQRAAVPVHSP